MTFHFSTKIYKWDLNIHRVRGSDKIELTWNRNGSSETIILTHQNNKFIDDHKNPVRIWVDGEEIVKELNRCYKIYIKKTGTKIGQELNYQRINEILEKMGY